MEKLRNLVYNLSITLLFFSCNSSTKINVDNVVVAEKSAEDIKLHQLNKLFVLGDFDGDGKKDTISQFNYSNLTKSEMIYSPDPKHNEWDTIVNWFYQQDATIFLKINTRVDSLNLGTAQGLYCLINMGDNNSDGKDEIAFVVDYLDHSRLNSCKIYSLCNKKWTLLKRFNIHEGSFDFVNGKKPSFDNIKNFLQKENGKWVYKDYVQDAIENQNEVGKMMQLELDKCN